MKPVTSKFFFDISLTLWFLETQKPPKTAGNRKLIVQIADAPHDMLNGKLF